MVFSGIGPIALGLLSALSWGSGDFCGGLATRRASLYGVVLVLEIGGGLFVAALAMALGEPVPAPGELLWAAAAGAAGAIGLAALYQGLAAGKMGLVAPVSAVIAALIPIVVSAYIEALPDALQLSGFGVALIGIWFLSRPEKAGFRVGDLALPLLAGFGFGLFFVLLDRASVAAVFWPLVAARATAAVLVAAVAVAARRPLSLPRSAWPLAAAAAALDVGGNLFYVLAAQAGELDVAAVLASLYPAATVALALIFLKERLTRPQWIGVTAALAAVGLIAA